MLVCLLVIVYKYINITSAGVKTAVVPQTSYTATDFSWQSQSLPEKDGIPYEKITLDVKGKLFPVGQYSGCDIKSEPPTEAGQISLKQCWFAGAGEDLAVFLENGTYVVKQRWVQESEGSDTSTPPNGPWEKLFIIQ